MENGHFTAEGLDYELTESFAAAFRNPTITSTEAAPEEVTTGAFESMADGRECDISSACHWAVGMAASANHGRMWGHAYSVTPSAIWVAPESWIKEPEELAGVEVTVGKRSGSHFSAIQALEAVVKPEQINLKFVGGPMDRLQLLLDRRVASGNVFGTAGYVLEQQGFRKVVDTTFMIGFLVETGANDEDAQKYFNALQRAQRDIDLEPERYKHYLLRELPEKYHSMLDVRRCGIGERLVFEPYTREVFEQTHRWMMTHDLIPLGQGHEQGYDQAVVR